MKEVKNQLSQDLIYWYSREKRSLPWREDRDPYKVWLSEIILQQTRVVQGLPYYYRFTEAFPTVNFLAEASETEVLRLWEGLGYYSRARNLHFAAQQVMNEYGGVFPKSFQELKKLKGVGEYTAAAIASICHDEAEPVIDGNVFRVVSRLYDISNDISIPATRKIFREVLLTIIDDKIPGEFNQAMMELGALICLPKNPRCEICPILHHCDARSKGRQEYLPVKGKKIKKRNRYFHYVVFHHNGSLALKRRAGGDIWQGLFDFYLFESSLPEPEPDGIFDSDRFTITRRSDYFRHILTHQNIQARFYVVEINDIDIWKETLNNFKLTSFSEDELVNLPKPKLIVNFLNSEWY